MKKCIFVSFWIMGFIGSAEAVESGKLSIRVNSAENNQGVVELHLMNSKAQFAGDMEAFRVCTEIIVNLSATCEFGALPYGEYAIYAFHDKNQDREMNTSVFGAPTEKVAVSAVDLAVNESPTFEQSKFTFNSRHGQVFLNLQ